MNLRIGVFIIIIIGGIIMDVIKLLNVLIKFYILLLIN